MDTALTAFEATLTASTTLLAAFVDSVKDIKALPQDKRQGLADAMREWSNAASAYASDRATLVTKLAAFCTSVTPPPQTNKAQHTARKVFDPLAVSARGLVKQIDLLYKLAARAAQLAQELTQDRAAQDEAADWSLTPGRFVGVAPAEVDEDFDLEKKLREIHIELAELNRESVELAVKIQTNFDELGI